MRDLFARPPTRLKLDATLEDVIFQFNTLLYILIERHGQLAEWLNNDVQSDIIRDETLEKINEEIKLIKQIIKLKGE